MGPPRAQHVLVACLLLFLSGSLLVDFHLRASLGLCPLHCLRADACMPAAQNINYAARTEIGTNPAAPHEARSPR